MYTAKPEVMVRLKGFAKWNEEVVGVVVELPIQSGMIKWHIDSLLPHGDNPSDAVLFEVIASVVPHDHSFPLIEGVRDDNRFPRVPTMV